MRSKDDIPKRVILREFGPSMNVEVEKYELIAPGAGQVAVRLLKAPINPSDLGVIMGNYRSLPELPGVPGREGVGEIYAVGEGVGLEFISKRVRMPMGTWQDSLVVDFKGLIFVPDDIPIDMAAMGFINPPTAWCLLNDFISLKQGDWIVQNAGNSAVGMWVIKLAHYFGYKTISIVRDMSWEKELKELGADLVFEEGSGWEKREECGYLARLALNSVGGGSGVKLIGALAEGGVHVTFGGMARDTIVWPTRDLIFRNITIKGFSLDRVRELDGERYLEILSQIFDFIRKTNFSVPVEKSYVLDNVKEAIVHASGYHRKGKILLESNWIHSR